MKCFYHLDADGKAAGRMVKQYLKHDDPTEQFIPINYGMDFFKLYGEMIPGETVYIVDYSIDPHEMIKLLSNGMKVTWIDHHKTAIEKYDGFIKPIRGIRVDGISGCMLTYLYLTQSTDGGNGPIKEITNEGMLEAPRYIHLINDYDLWQFHFANATKDFVMAFNTYDYSPESREWAGMERDSEVDLLIKQGMFMRRYRESWAKNYMDFGYEIKWHDVPSGQNFIEDDVVPVYNCYVVNLGLCNSSYFDSLPEGKYDIYIAFSYKKDHWSISMYSKTVDVGAICKRYGGGGHKGAAGFTTKDYPKFLHV